MPKGMKGFQAGHKINLGRPCSEETKQKLCESKLGPKNPNWGKTFSKETRQKMAESNLGPKNPRWKGGVFKSRECYFIQASDHPHKNSRGYIRRARLIAEKVLGRYLKKGEVVHHINRNPFDDINSNLLVCSRAYHGRLHHKLSIIEKKKSKHS